MNDDKVFEVFKDEDDIDKIFARGKSKPFVSIHGLDLQSEDTKRIERQIQQVLEEEIAKYDQAKNRAAEVKPKPTDKKEVTISLIGLDLSYEDTKRIERQIQQVLEEEIAKYGRTLENIRICTHEPPGLWVKRPYPIQQLADIPIPKEGEHVTAVYYFQEDTVLVTIFNASVAPGGAGYPPYVFFQLCTGGRSFYFSGWEKEIFLWNACGRFGRQYVRQGGFNQCSDWFQPGDNYVPGWSIVFRKPKEFGRWYNMYWLEPSIFKNTFGGKAVRFEWIHDTWGRP